MTLGEIITQYRNEHKMSQREFARRCGMSNSYLSMLEQNRNYKNGQPIIPSLVTIKAVSDAMARPLGEVLEAMGDEPLSLEADSDISENERELLRCFRACNAAGQQVILATAQSISINPDMKKDRRQKSAG